ncbi:sulfotransferase domain-containing protein [Thermodesulfobacteriota bacterium]
MESVHKNKLNSIEKNGIIIVVSGLPRCGTSMMMQMLAEGGMQIVTDSIRKADEDNPRGYFEFEKVKEIKEDTKWLDDCIGKAFKMVSALLYYLPINRKYRVIFMKRKMEEMLASQNVMLQRKGEKTDSVTDKAMIVKLEEHLHDIEAWLAKQRNIDVIYISYNNVIQNPLPNSERVNQFLGNQLDVDKMAGVIEKSLYRQQKKDV